MNEADMRRVLLARALDEEAPDLVAPPLRVEARRAGGDPGDLAGWLVRRARFLCERLPGPLVALADQELPPHALRGALPLVAAAVGALGGVLGPSHRIHALVNPAVGLMLWNLAVYGVALLPLTRPPLPGAPGARSATGRRRTPWPVAALRAGARWIGRRSAGSEGVVAGAKLRGSYFAAYASACSRPILDRSARLFHLSAIAFALGALVGMYLRGVVFEYHVVWGSTIVESPAVRAAIARVLFWPAALALGEGFPDAEALRLAATPDGAPAAPWLHAWAICLAAYVLLPRAVLAARAGIAARRHARDVALDLSDPAWAGLAAGREPSGADPLERRVLRWFALDAVSCGVLASLQSELIREDVEEEWRGRHIVARVTGQDSVQQKKDWHRDWRAVVEQGFAAFPETDRPAILDARAPELASAIQHVRSGSNPFAAELVLLELAAFEAYWPFAPHRKGVAVGLRAALRPRLHASVRERALRRAGERLGTGPELGPALRTRLEREGRHLAGSRRAPAAAALAGVAVSGLALGLAAPFLAGVIGHAMGLHGLAAVSAGLAALAGGALAHGALGLAGGATVLVGGGALLGLGAGAGTAWVAEATSASVLVAGAKIDVFLHAIVQGRHRDGTIAREIVDELRKSVEGLRAELPDLIHHPDVDTAGVRDRERALEILERVLARAEESVETGGGRGK